MAIYADNDPTQFFCEECKNRVSKQSVKIKKLSLEAVSKNKDLSSYMYECKCGALLYASSLPPEVLFGYG